MSLAAAGSLDLATAANTTVQVMGAFELQAQQTEEAANALAGAANASSADVSDLTQGLSQVSAQANNAGWSIQQTSAVLAAFADSGIKGSDAGTSLKTMLQRLAAPVDKAKEAIKLYNLQVRDSNGNMLGAAEIAGELQAKLGGLSSAQRDAALQAIFGSDASRAALTLMKQGTEGIQKYIEATSDQGAAQRMANAQMGESERTLENMKGAIETASIALGDGFAPIVTDVAESVADLAEWFGSLSDEGKDAAIKIALIAAGMGPLISISGKASKVMATMVAAYRDATAAGDSGSSVSTNTRQHRWLPVKSLRLALHRLPRVPPLLRLFGMQPCRQSYRCSRLSFRRSLWRLSRCECGYLSGD